MSNKYFQVSFLLVNGHYQNANNEHWMRQVPRRPVDVMTDVINNLGINILQQYHVPGNVAFSPTGLGFVLIALYEGSAGRGSKQIADCLQLPHDRQITRIGLRDIHRRLRVNFIFLFAHLLFSSSLIFSHLLKCINRNFRKLFNLNRKIPIFISAVVDLLLFLQSLII